MKKLWGLITTIIVFVCVFALLRNDNTNGTNKKEEITRDRLESSASVYPVYDRLSGEEKEFYVKVCSAFENFSEGTSYVFESDSKAEVNEFKDEISWLYREVAYEQSEMFWVDPYNWEYEIWDQGGKYKLRILPKYLLEKEDALQKQEVFDEKLEYIVKRAEQQSTTYYKVLFVHDYILSNTEYDSDIIENDDFSTTGINAYGCLVDGKTICSGYTMAFDAIMKRLGFECGAEFNSYSKLSLSEGHVWNYCNLDGEYYCFDLTWDDVAKDDAIAAYTDYHHTYFAITTEELRTARKFLEPGSPAPVCNGTKYNYYVHNNTNFATYDYNAVKSALLMQSGKKYASIRFDSYSEMLKAKADLIDNSKLFEIFTDTDEVLHMTSESGLQLYIFFK